MNRPITIKQGTTEVTLEPGRFTATAEYRLVSAHRGMAILEGEDGQQYTVFQGDTLSPKISVDLWVKP